MKFKSLQTDDIGDLGTVIQEIRKNDENGFKSQWAGFYRKCVGYANGEMPNSSGNLASTYSASPIILPNKQTLKRGSDQYYQTNEISPAMRTLVSYLTRQKPTIEVFSLDDDDIKSNAIAKVARQVSDALYDLDNELENSRESATWLLSTGTVFRKDFFNFKKNRNEVAILSGYNISFDYSVTDFNNIRWIAEQYVQDVDWVKESFDGRDEEGNLLPGYTGLASEIDDNGDGSVGQIMQQLEEMKTAVAYRGSKKQDMTGKVLVTELYVEPSDDYPQGRFIVMAGDQVVYMTSKGMDNPYYLGKGDQDWHPYTPCIYEKYIGRAMGKSLVEQCISIQKRLNEINGAILRNANTVAKPNIFTVEGQLKRNYMNGENANIYTYDIMPGADKPSMQMGTPLPQQFFNERASLVDSLVRILGTNFVMQGQPPTGVSAASAISQLLENANNQHSPAVQNFAMFIQKGLTKKLRILKKFNTVPNETLNKYLRMLSKKSYNTEYKMFTGVDDLADELYVKIEPSTIVPKSETAKNEMYQTIIKEGGLPVFAEDSPRGEKTRSFMFKKMGLDDIPSELSVERKKAEWENERVILGLPITVNEYDVGMVHIPCHTEVIQNPDFLENATREQYEALVAHIAEHKAKEQEVQQLAEIQAMEQQVLSGVPPEGETPPSSDAVSVQ